MSVVVPILNRCLRAIEKPALARAEDPLRLRRRFEINARLLFHAPRGTRRAWRRLAHETGAREVLDIRPQTLRSDMVLFYVHGGAFIMGSPNTHSALLAQLGRRLGMRAVLPRYSMAPEVTFPTAGSDIKAAFEALCAEGVSPDRVIIGGDSAGGALALGLLAELLAERSPLPAGAFCFSPLTDLTCSGESFRSNEESDVLLPAHRAAELMEMYLGGHPATDPQASPLFADFGGAPPVWLTVGDTEVLADDSRRLAARLAAQKVDVTLVEEHDLPHVWPIFHNVLPEARKTLDGLAQWIMQRHGPPIGS